MILKILVLLVSVAQVAAAAFLSIGTFEDSARDLPVLIQPAGWAFSIWGLIYALAIVYGVYQIIPKYDNKTLQATRLPALIGFLGSIVWLYFAGMSDWTTWLTIPVLFAMAIAFTYVVRAPETNDIWQNRFSKYILLPYAAWAGIASWINVQALLLERNVVTTEGVNVATNVALFIGIVVFTMYYYKKTGYKVWYGGVMVWAAVSVAIVNYQREDWLFMVLAGAFAITAALLCCRYKRRA